MRCYALHRLSYFPSEPSQLVPIGPELAVELKGLMAARGFFQGEVDDHGTRLFGNGGNSSWAVRTTTTASTVASCLISRFWPTCAASTGRVDPGLLTEPYVAEPGHPRRVTVPPNARASLCRVEPRGDEARYRCAGGWRTPETRSSPTTCCSGRSTRSSIRVCTPGSGGDDQRGRLRHRVVPRR